MTIMTSTGPAAGGRALALVESPAQLLNVVEWTTASGVPVDVVVAAPRGAHGRLQLHAVAELVAGVVDSISWCEARVGPRATLRAIRSLAPQVQRADVLVLGDPFSRLLQALVPLFRGRRLVVVDDGTATLEFADLVVKGDPIVRWHKGRVNEADKILARAASRRLRRCEIFTAMPLPEPTASALEVTRNGYYWLRGQSGPTQAQPGAALIGTSLVETGVVDTDAYLGAIAQLASSQDLRCYYAHRRESGAKLSAIAAVGLRIERPGLPLELELARGPVPQRLLSFPSTVLHTLPVVLAGRDVSVEALEVDPSWLTAGLDERAGNFLAQAVTPLAS